MRGCLIRIRQPFIIFTRDSSLHLQNRPEWNANELKPYVYTEGETGFHFLFDGFLFLEIFDNIQGYEWDPGFKFKTGYMGKEGIQTHSA